VAYETILYVDNPSLARSLIAALKAYGFTPMEGGEAGLPGMPGVLGPRGIGIQVPEDQVEDAAVLAQELLASMKDDSSNS
jgi:hypothetical protein